MTSEQFEEILRKIPSLKRIHLQGLGEPLLTPDLQKIIDISKERGIFISTTTNGSLLHIEKYRNLALQFDEIDFSFDSTTKENFEKIRIGGNFDVVLEGMTLLSKQNKEAKGKTRINLNFVATYLNYAQIPDLADIAIALGVNKVGVTQMENWYTPAEKGFADSHAFVLRTSKSASEINKLTSELRARLKPHGIDVLLGGYDKRKGICTWPFKRTFITVDGLVTPCCIRDSEAINFGSIYSTDDFDKIWNGPEFKKFREANIKDLPNPVCDNCPF
jgi:pyrroloquinoline quinone biosynthesis protein E